MMKRREAVDRNPLHFSPVKHRIFFGLREDYHFHLRTFRHVLHVLARDDDLGDGSS